jgi:hypothetical protein
MISVIVSIQKNEPALNEWVKYHLYGCGFDRIVLFDDGGLPQVEDPNVEIHKVEDVLKRFQADQYMSRQQLCYLYYMKILFPSTEDTYALFIDGDEYWAGPMTVKEFLAKKDPLICDFALNWVFFTSEEEPGAPKDSVLRRFCHRKDHNDKHIKSLVNMAVHRYEPVYFGCPHCLQSSKVGLVPWMNTSGQIGMGPYSEFQIDFKNHPYIAHFYTKSREEYVQKLTRGRPDTSNPDYQYYSSKMASTMEGLWHERSVGDTVDYSLKSRLEGIS